MLKPKRASAAVVDEIEHIKAGRSQLFIRNVVMSVIVIVPSIAHGLIADVFSDNHSFLQMPLFFPISVETDMRNEVV